MVADVAHIFASSIKIWDRKEVMNLNQNEIIITLRIYLSEKWAKKSHEFLIVVYRLPVGYRQKQPSGSPRLNLRKQW